MPPGGPAGVGRPWGGTDAALDEGRAREASAIGRGPPGCPSPLLVRGPRREQRAPGGCFLDPQAAGVEEVKASVKQAPPLPPSLQGCSFSPTHPLSAPLPWPSGFYEVCLPGGTA